MTWMRFMATGTCVNKVPVRLGFRCRGGLMTFVVGYDEIGTVACRLLRLNFAARVVVISSV